MAEPPFTCRIVQLFYAARISTLYSGKQLVGKKRRPDISSFSSVWGYRRLEHVATPPDSGHFPTHAPRRFGLADAYITDLCCYLRCAYLRSGDGRASEREVYRSLGEHHGRVSTVAGRAAPSR
jgi:hypothetical protein